MEEEMTMSFLRSLSPRPVLLRIVTLTGLALIPGMAHASCPFAGQAYGTGQSICANAALLVCQSNGQWAERGRCRAPSPSVPTISHVGYFTDLNDLFMKRTSTSAEEYYSLHGFVSEDESKRRASTGY